MSLSQGLSCPACTLSRPVGGLLLVLLVLLCHYYSNYVPQPLHLLLVLLHTTTHQNSYGLRHATYGTPHAKTTTTATKSTAPVMTTANKITGSSFIIFSMFMPGFCFDASGFLASQCNAFRFRLSRCRRREMPIACHEVPRFVRFPCVREIRRIQSHPAQQRHRQQTASAINARLLSHASRSNGNIQTRR